MRKEDVKIGMKVVPFRKTVDGWSGLKESVQWKRAKDKNQPFLFVVAWDADEGCWGLSWNRDGRRNNAWDFFNSSDFRKYEPARVNDGPLTMEFLNG